MNTRRTITRIAAPTVAAVGLLALAACGSTGGGATADSGPAAASQPTTSAPAKPAPAKPAPAKPAPAKKWHTLATMKGRAEKQSDTITTHGGRVRLTYKFTADDPEVGLMGVIYLLPEGQDVHVDGGIPELMVTKAVSDSTILRKGAGRYYLAATATLGTYTITVQEER